MQYPICIIPHVISLTTMGLSSQQCKQVCFCVPPKVYTTSKTNAERQHLQKSLWAGRCPTYGLWNLLLGSIGRNSCSLPEKALKATTFILLLREYGRAVFYASFKDFRHIYSALNRKKYRGSQFTEWCLFLMNERVKLSTLHSKYVGGKQEIKLLKTF